MALSDDYRMYYRNSFIGKKVGDEIVPFYVEEVFSDFHPGPRHDEFDEDDERDDDDYEYADVPDSVHYSEEAYQHLRFIGYTYTNGTSNRRSETITYADTVLENPSGGYFKIDNVFVYVSYRPIRQAKKGLTRERINHTSSFNFEKVACAMYTSTPDPQIKMSGALVLGNDVMYKGLKIGTYSEPLNQVIITVAEAEYLVPFIERALQSCQTTVVMNPL